MQIPDSSYSSLSFRKLVQRHEQERGHGNADPLHQDWFQDLEHLYHLNSYEQHLESLLKPQEQQQEQLSQQAIYEQYLEQLLQPQEDQPRTLLLEQAYSPQEPYGLYCPEEIDLVTDQQRLLEKQIALLQILQILFLDCNLGSYGQYLEQEQFVLKQLQKQQDEENSQQHRHLFRLLLQFSPMQRYRLASARRRSVPEAAIRAGFTGGNRQLATPSDTPESPFRAW